MGVVCRKSAALSDDGLVDTLQAYIHHAHRLVLVTVLTVSLSLCATSAVPLWPCLLRAGCLLWYVPAVVGACCGEELPLL